MRAITHSIILLSRRIRGNFRARGFINCGFDQPELYSDLVRVWLLGEVIKLNRLNLKQILSGVLAH